jgi:SAM-dependent methyltransferase
MTSTGKPNLEIGLKNRNVESHSSAFEAQNHRPRAHGNTGGAKRMRRGEIDQLEMITRLPRAATIVRRIDYLAGLARSRSVIHIGFGDAGYRSTQARAGTWLHEHLSAIASSLVGLDVDRESVEMAREAGFTAHVVNCCDVNAIRALELRSADLVVAGEVIEHLDAPGAFLDAMHVLVRPNGLLALTTPNASGLGNALAALAGFEVNHPDHVILFSCRTLGTLLERHGWTVVETRTYVPEVKKRDDASLRSRVLRVASVTLRSLEEIAGRVGRPFVADGLIMVARSNR